MLLRTSLKKQHESSIKPVFFRVAAFLNPSFKLNPGEKELLEKQQEERQNINNLLKGVPTLDEI